MSNGQYRQLELKSITGVVRVKTGLRIGGSQAVMEISGIDNPIIRNPANDDPYIPGSSLKGKLRALTEWDMGKVAPDGKPYCNDKDVNCPITRVFGGPASQTVKIGPTRLIVRDALLSDTSRDRYLQGNPITEVKYENSINRLTARAVPRPMERVLPEVEFALDMVYRVLDLDDGGKTDRSNFAGVVLRALALLQKDYLGSCGSRGCGKIEFVDLKDEKGVSLSLPNI